MVSDMMDEKDADSWNMISLSIECDSIDQLEKVFQKCLKAEK